MAFQQHSLTPYSFMLQLGCMDTVILCSTDRPQPRTQPYLMAGHSAAPGCGGLNQGDHQFQVSWWEAPQHGPSCAARRAWHWL